MSTLTRYFMQSMILVAAFSSFAAADEDALTVIRIYGDQYEGQPAEDLTAIQQMFAPYGFMPAERSNQTSVNPSRAIDDADPEKGTCIEYSFEFKNGTDWQGAYHLVNGDAWGTKPGIDVAKMLSLAANDKVTLKFLAWGATGGEVITLQCGGVNNGPNRSSLSFPKTTKNDPVMLTKEPREYSIDLKAGQLSNIVDPFCVVARASDGTNLRRENIIVFVDDIRFEIESKQKEVVSLPDGWRSRLAETLWFDYTPTGYDPTQNPPKRPTMDDMRLDLEAIYRISVDAGVPKDRIGVVLYGTRDGLELIPELCREIGLAAVLGVWDVKDAAEVQAVEKLLQDDSLSATIAAVCVGNEAMTFGRATLDELLEVVSQLRDVRIVPMTTTEIIQKYGNDALFTSDGSTDVNTDQDHVEFDFVFCNIHGLFNASRGFEPESAAKWTVDCIRDLQAVAPAGQLILVKEVGWVNGPSPTFDESQQTAFWKAVLDDPVTGEINVCVFEASFGKPDWKHEFVTVQGQKVDVGAHWSVFHQAPRREPNSAGQIILNSRAESYRK